MRISPESSGATVVFVGKLNPPIFQPEWFAREGLLAASEAAAAEVRMISDDLTSFSVDWMNLHVQRDRLMIDTAQAPFVRLRDLLVRTFREFLIHTPIYMVGINRQVHFRAGSFEIRDKVGLRLAPQDVWGQWATAIHGRSEDDYKKRGGMNSLTMMQSDREDGREGNINATVQPSVLFPPDGIYMQINDHVVLGNASNVFGANGAVDLLEADWESSNTKAEMIIDQIMGLVEEVKRSGS